MPFTTPLRVEALGADQWRLTESLIYESVSAGTIIVPDGFTTDFASVPRLPFAYWLTGNTAHAPAVLHDWLYCAHSLSRRQADAAFYEAMRETGVPWWRAVVMWLGVRLVGWATWPVPDR